MVDLVLKILLFLSPIAYTTGMPLERFDLMFFYIGTFLLLLASLFDHPRRNGPRVELLISLMTLALLNLFWHGFKSVIFNSFVSLFVAVVAFTILVRYADDLKEYVPWILAAGVVNIVVLAFQYFGFSPIILNPDGEPGGIMGNAPRLGSYLAITVPVAASVGRPWQACLIYFLFIFTGVLINEFSVPLVALVCLAIKYKVDWKPLALLGGVFIWVYWPDMAQSWRVRMFAWKPTLGHIFLSPLMGHGLGAFPAVSDQFMDKMHRSDTAFSSMLQFVFAVGLLGAWWIIHAVRKVYRHFNTEHTESYCLLAIILLSVFEYPFEIPRLWFTMLALVAFFVIKNHERLNTNEEDFYINLWSARKTNP